jgi:putative tryptophan/tyrosine transport system substrate-binding protein
VIRLPTIRTVLMSALLLCGSSNSAHAARYQAMIVTWSGGCEEACAGLQAYFKDKGIDATFVLRDADGKKEALSGFLAEARSARVDLIVTHGTNATLGMAGRLSERGKPGFLPEIPKIFMIVADPVGAGLVRSLDVPGRPDLTGTYNRVPERVNIETLRAYRPQFRRLGLLYHTNEQNSVMKRDELASLSASMGFELLAQELPLGPHGRPKSSDIMAQMAALKGAGADFVYVGSSTFLRENSKLLAEAAARVGLPVLSPYESLARDGQALLSVAARYADVGRLAGQQAEKVLRHGATAGSLPVARMAKFAVVINMQVARKLNLMPPLDLLQIAEIVN